jgi:solute carrier family 25 oxoglutarate transporter 11
MEYAFHRKLPGAFLGAAITSMTSVPFEMAKMAYYGDKTFPKELQRGF